MKIQVDDLEMALKWIKQNSGDLNVRIDLDSAYMTITTSTPDQEIVKLKLYDAEHSLQAKILKEDYLKHNVKIDKK